MKFRMIWMGIVVTVVLFAVGPYTTALAQDATPTPDPHAGHHMPADATPIAAPSADAAGTGGQMDTGAMHSQIMEMMGMMDQMMVMDMPADMKAMIDEMRGKMDGMMQGMMGGAAMDMSAMHGQLEDMMGMMDKMKSMPMSDEMKAMMKQMRGQMDAMMQGMMGDTSAPATGEQGAASGMSAMHVPLHDMMATMDRMMASEDLPTDMQADMEKMHADMQSMMDDLMAGKADMAAMHTRMMGMMGAMDKMMAMDMPVDMKTMMEEMRGKMDGMMQGVMGSGAAAPAGDHAAHHPGAPAGGDGSDSGMAGMGMMAGMGDMMKNMDGHMQKMKDMMATMDKMMAADMPPEMKADMEKMRGDMQSMMDEMMGGMMGSMDGETGGAPADDHAAHHPAAEAGGDMAAMDMGAGDHHMAPISSAGVPDATEQTGAQPLAPTVEDGVKVFNITAKPVIWYITDDVTVTAWTYNGTVPGPLIRVTEGDKVRIVFKNELPEPTTVHWHGIAVPNAMDGVPDMTQPAIQSGATFTYEFTAQPAGSYMYHSHFQPDKQVSIGLYAPFIIDPVQPAGDAPAVDVPLMLSEWRVVDGQTYPAMPATGMDANYFTVNGKAYPATETMNVKVGDRVRLRLMNIGQMVHPIHLHGFPFKIVATDGHPVPEAAQLTKDTVSLAPGERYDIEFVATEPGMWMVHCHIAHHTTNAGEEPGGMMWTINVTE